MQISEACLFSLTAAATEPPADNWQNSYKPSNTGQSSPTLTAIEKKKSRLCAEVRGHSLENINLKVIKCACA